MPSRPAGTVTFLFSDIEGSTGRWESRPDQMRRGLRDHDNLLRHAIRAHKGYVFKTVGDAFCAAFARASDAVAAAIEAQRAITAQDFSAVDGLAVRMAVHTGESEERDGDYFGTALNRVARLLSLGHGGQVLVSEATAQLLEGQMPPSIGLRDLGTHRLKDLTLPERVYQLTAPELRDFFPALNSLGDRANNLPQQLTSFIGRQKELAEIRTLLAQSRLVTIVGTGGVGKTRAALQIGADLLAGSDDGVWLVDLAPVTDQSFVAAAIAHALSVQETQNRPLLETLLAHLAKKRLVLILDNCEHLITEVERIAAAALKNCAGVRILATSREPLHIPGEQVYRIPSLPVPRDAPRQTAATAIECGSVQLFVDRALAVNARFRLTDENAPSVAEICERLDGIPLATELAAARSNVLAPAQLAQRLDQRFRLLTGGDRTALPRQQRMRALIDWSYDLLTDRERALFRALAVFAGSFTYDSAESVCANGIIPKDIMLDLLSSLVDKSLVQSEAAEKQTRYRFLETNREYALEKLVGSGEEDLLCGRHAAAYTALAEELEQDWATRPDDVWTAQAEPELANWRKALDWTLTRGHGPIEGARLTGALRWVWWTFAPAEGRRWIHAASAAIQTANAPRASAKLSVAEAQIAGVLGDFKVAHAAAVQALELYRQLNDPAGIADAQRLAGSALIHLDRTAEGENHLMESLAASRTLGTQRLTGLVLRNLAVARQIQGDTATARTLLAEALGLFKATGATRVAGIVAVNLAEVEFQAGNAENALKIATEAIGADSPLHGAASDVDLSNIAAYLISLGRYDQARARARDALAAARDAQSQVHIAIALQHLAAVAALMPGKSRESADSDVARAAKLMGYVDQCIAALEVRREFTERDGYEKMLAALQRALGSAKLRKLMDEGGQWSEDHAIDQAFLV